MGIKIALRQHGNIFMTLLTLQNVIRYRVRYTKGPALKYIKML